MSILIVIVLSFIASLSFIFIFNAPKRLAIPSGLAGCCGFLVSYILDTYFHWDPMYAKFVAGLTLGIISQILVRFYKTPVINFLVTGIIPLVPGAILSKATEKLFSLDFAQAINTFIHGMLIAGAIALGLIIANTIARVLRFNLLLNREDRPESY
ncbi:threonine/serine exporter family protein [Staphylococcus massiliensis]|uniref:threonine/serine exporter family protein n=1 Tax=Staphylococcus massiliensis TaxID=555791 RepID=UPI00370DB744